MPALVKRRDEITPVAASDGAVVWEFFRKGEGIDGVGVASGYLPPGRTATPHLHLKSDEIYIVTAGSGRVILNGVVHDVKVGDQVFVPVNTVHSLENTGAGPLEVICISSPPYEDEDFITAQSTFVAPSNFVP